MGKYILIFLILIIPSFVFSNNTYGSGINISVAPSDLSWAGSIETISTPEKKFRFSVDAGFSAIDAGLELNSTLHILVHPSDTKAHFYYLFSYNTYFEAPIMGFEIATSKRYLAKTGMIYKDTYGFYLNFGYLFENDISITFSQIDSPTKLKIGSILSFDIGYHF